MKKTILLTGLVLVLAISILPQDIYSFANNIFKKDAVHNVKSKDLQNNNKQTKKNIISEIEFKQEFKTSHIVKARQYPSVESNIIIEIPNEVRVASLKKATVNNITWYFIRYNGKEGWVLSNSLKEYIVIKKEVLLEIPVINQLPELPRGCEVTSLAMLLNHAGVETDKMKLANQVKKDNTPYSKKNGEIYFGNPYNGFVGDMHNIKNEGYGVYHGPIRELGEIYLPGRMVDLTGQDFENIYVYLNKGKPVWVIINTLYNIVPANQWIYWNTPNGKVKITKREHSVLITGYDDNYIYFNDPLTNLKNRKVNKENFIKGWRQMGSQAISYN